MILMLSKKVAHWTCINKILSKKVISKQIMFRKIQWYVFTQTVQQNLALLEVVTSQEKNDFTIQRILRVNSM